MAIIGEIYKVGVPSIIMQSIGSLMTYGMNQILLAFTSTAATVFGVYFKLQSFVFMPIFGLNNGMVPIVAYNFGARNQIFPAQLFAMFDASETMLAIGVPALRIISLSFVLAGFGIVSGSVFQALGNGVYSLIVSVARQLLVLLPVAFLLSLTGNLNAVWWAFPIAELVSFGVSVFFLIRIYRVVIRHIGE